MVVGLDLRVLRGFPIPMFLLIHVFVLLYSRYLVLKLDEMQERVYAAKIARLESISVANE